MTSAGVFLIFAPLDGCLMETRLKEHSVFERELYHVMTNTERTE